MADKKVKIEVETEVNAKKLKDLKSEINDVDGEKIDLDINADDTQLKSAKKEFSDFDGETANVDIHADDSEIKSAQKEIDNMKGEKIDIKINVDDSDLKSADKEVKGLGGEISNSLGSTQNAVTGLVSTMAGKSVWDVVYGTSTKAETNKVLLKGMSDSTVAFQDFYNTVDKTTDSSLISMQALIPGLNGIQKATGATGAEMQAITPQVAAFGQYVLALTGSEAQAESAMFDLSKGIKGAWASLDQYGITEESLMKTGLWSGKEDDVKGYMEAVQAVTGSTDELMDTTVGLEALMGKAFSRGGKKIGAELLPRIKDLLQGFINLDSATGGWLSTSMLLAGGALSGIVSFLSIAGQAINGIKMLADAYKFLTAVEWAEAIAGMASIGWIILAIALGLALGYAIVWLYNNVDWFREGIDWLGASFQNLVNLIWGSVIGTFDWLRNLFTEFTNQVGLNTSNWQEAIVGFIMFLPQLPLRAGQLLLDTLAKAWGFGDNFTSTMINGAVNSVNGFISWIAQLPFKLWEELSKMLKMAEDFAMRIADTLTFGGASMVTGWQYGSGEQSPGFMYDSLVGELQEMEKAPDRFVSGITNKMGNVGKGMVNEFSRNQNGYSLNKLGTYDNSSVLNETLSNIISHGGKQELNLTLNVGSVDKRERVQEIIDIIKNEIMWDNKKAGRSV